MYLLELLHCTLEVFTLEEKENRVQAELFTLCVFGTVLP